MTLHIIRRQPRRVRSLHISQIDAERSGQPANRRGGSDGNLGMPSLLLMLCPGCPATARSAGGEAAGLDGLRTFRPGGCLRRRVTDVTDITRLPPNWSGDLRRRLLIDRRLFLSLPRAPRMRRLASARGCM